MAPAIDEVRVELSVVDLPEAIDHGLHAPAAYAPTMRQAQDAAMTVDNGIVLATDALADLLADPERRPFWNPLLRFAFQLPAIQATAELPIPTRTWMHEEWHRAALRVEGVHSRNGNSPRLWQGTVYDVTDADMAELKARDPAAWNRTLSAGLESEVEMNRRVVREDFFLRDQSHMPAVLLSNAWHTWQYYRLSTGPIADDIRDWNLEHQGGELERDFAGLDPVALARDLHRPDEPYADRGPHPSGEGIARPVAWSDLTEEEQAWLRRRRDWSLLNFVSPMALLVHHVGDEVQVGGMLHHRATSFGSRTGLDVMVRSDGLDLAVMAALDRNLGPAPYGTLDVSLVRQPLPVGGLDLALTPRLAAWWQPRDLDPTTTAGMVGGLASLRADARLRGRLSAFLEVEGKTRGELSGNPYLDPAGALRAGLTLDTAAAWP